MHNMLYFKSRENQKHRRYVITDRIWYKMVMLNTKMRDDGRAQ